MISRHRTAAVLVAGACAQLALANCAIAQRFTKPDSISALPAPVALEQRDRFQASISRVGEDVFVGGQPTELGLREMRAHGVTTVVNLRTPPEMTRDVKFDEGAVAASLGMRYINLPVRGTSEYPYSPETVARFSEALRQANGKVLLHCTIGWRASHLWAAYLIKERGIPVDQALANARAINLMDMHHSASDGPQPVEEFLGYRVTFPAAAPR